MVVLDDSSSGLVDDNGIPAFNSVLLLLLLLLLQFDLWEVWLPVMPSAASVFTLKTVDLRRSECQ